MKQTGETRMALVEGSQAQVVSESDWPLAEGIVVVVKGVVRPPIAVAQLKEVGPRLCEVCSASAGDFNAAEGVCPLLDECICPQLDSGQYQINGPLAH